MRLPRLTRETLNAEQAALYSEIAEGPRAQGVQHFELTARDGSLNGPFNAFLFAPGIAGSLQALGSAIRFETNLSSREREIAILIVAARWRSSFERTSHESVGRAAGLTDAELSAIAAGGVPALHDERERVIAHTTLALTQGDLDDEQWATASAVLTPQTLVELSTLVGYYATIALQLRIFRVDDPEDFVGGDRSPEGERE